MASLKLAMYRPIRFCSGLLLIWLLAAVGVAAQSEEISILITTETPSFNVGDRVALDVTVRHPAMYRVIAPDLVGAWGELEVLDIVPLSIEPSGGAETTRLRIMVTAWEPNTYTTPELTLNMSDAEGNLIPISADPIILTVVTILNEADLTLRDIKPQAAIADLSRLLRNLVIGIVIAVLIAIGSYYAFYRNQRQAEAIALQPEVDLRLPNVVALETIDAIEARNLPDEGLFNEHYTQITDVMRQYLENSYNIAAMEATTFEIRRDLRKDSRLDAATRMKLIGMLQSADLVKFARAKPDLKAAKLLPGRARSFIRESYAQLPPETVPDEPQEVSAS